MSDSINAISANSSASQANSASSALNSATKKKLEALGLDPKKYTTEAAAQEAITEAQAKQQPSPPPKPDGTSFETIKTKVQDLASKIGIAVGTNDKTADILTKISNQITELKSAAGTDASKLSAVNGYQSQYTTISSELSQLESAKNMTGASALANYNKAALGLAA